MARGRSSNGHLDDQDESKLPRFKRDVQVELTQEEVAKKGKRAGKLNAQIAKVKDEMDSVTRSHKEKLKELRAELNSTLQDIESEKETRSLKVYQRRNFENNRVETVRDDNGEIVDHRAMTAEDRQEMIAAVKVDDDGPAASVHEMPRRGRGRPRKNPLPKEETPGTA